MQAEHSHEVNHGPINYGQTKYWDKRYQQRTGQRYEWLQPYARLKPFLQQCMPEGKQTRILNLGCGNGTLQQQLYEDGYHHITNNDISTIVIEQMQKCATQKGYDMRFDVMDVRELKYADESFDLVIDKSTIDSLMCSDSPLLNVAKMIEEGYRVLKEGGYYFTVSYNGSRMQHFVRQIYKFQVTKKEVKKLDVNGMEMVNHLYICKKQQMDKPTQEQRAEFYLRLKEVEEKEYPL